MKTFRIALLGFGVAGQAFSRILLDKKDEVARDTGYDVLVTAIATGSHGCLVDPAGIDLGIALQEYQSDGRFDDTRADYSTRDSLAVAEQADYDALLEMTPINIRTGRPAIDHLRIAMNRGKHAVSANKGPLAYAYDELKELAEKNGVRFLYETTVMAGTPLFGMAENCLAYCRISRVQGIVSPREVFKSCILSNAAAFIAIHNHPSGSMKPSQEDIETTKRLQKCGEILDIPMLDHIVVAGETGEQFSFRENGLFDHTMLRDGWER